MQSRLAARPESGRMEALRTLQELRLGGRSGLPRPVARISPGLWAFLALSTIQALLALAGAATGDLSQRKVPAGPVLVTLVVFSGAGLLLCLLGRRDRRAQSLAGFFLGVAGATAVPFLRLLPRENLPPACRGVLAGLAFLPETLLPFFLWRFTSEFPRVLRLDRWDGTVRWAIRWSGIAGSFLAAVNALHRMAPDFSPALFSPFLRNPGSLYWLLLLSLALPAPFVAWLRSHRPEAEERRRVRWFLSGIAIGILPLFSLVLIAIFRPELGQKLRPPAIRPLAYVLYGFLCTIPVTTTYAVTAHRVLTLRIVMRKAARLALARGSLLGLALVPSLWLVVHLYRQRARPLGALWTESPVPELVAFAVFEWGLYALRGPLLRRLEDLLVGQRRDPSLVLGEFGREARNARTAAELAQILGERLVQLVVSERSALLWFAAEQRVYLDVERRLRPLPRAGGLARLVAAAPEPLLLGEDDRGSLIPWLTEEDRHWIADSEVHLIVPVLGSEGETLGLLVLGPTRGGLPYGPAEQQAITVLATAASLALERILERGKGSAGEGPKDEPAGECRRCGSVAPGAEAVCVCGEPMTPAVIPYELAGKFRLESILGQGGMGVVYRATDLTLNRPAALKTLPHLRLDALSRLRREARSMAEFLHPNLALIFSAETWRGVPVLVVEYLAGRTLADRLRSGALSPEEVVRLGLDLAGALEAMHRKDLLHRDVKPSNIGFTEEGTPKLLDFGLAHLIEEARLELGPARLEREGSLRMTRTGQVVGTPLYLSPEALAGAPPSRAQDLWALHLVLWEALTGEHPCSGLSQEAALRRLAQAEIPDILTVRPDCPPALAALLARGLGSALRQRLSTAAAVRASFTSMSGGENHDENPL